MFRLLAGEQSEGVANFPLSMETQGLASEKAREKDKEP
jgi:hypothetical protein